MFLNLKPLSGDWNLLVLAFAVLVTGCSSLQSSPTAEATSAVAVATPADSLDASENESSRAIVREQASLPAAAQPDPYDALDFFDFEHHEPLVLDLAIELQAQQADLELKKQRRLEAEAALALAASLEEARKNDNAWYRLQQGMKLTTVSNRRVSAQLKWFMEHPGYLQRVMERARPILPFVLDELERRNLPSELALLPVVESAYQAFAYSHGRASGMWQIIPSTGRFLGLKQNWWYDGRRDIIESTHAAITYLETLAKQFDGDWELALAAYNAGPGKIRGAVRYNKKRKHPTDFWHLTKIRKETRDYVPKMFALKELFANPEKYQLDLVPVNNQVSYEIVELDGQIDLALAAELAGITVNQLYQLNPAFNRWATAPDGPHRLLLPRGKAEQFKLEVAKIPPQQAH